MSVSIEKTNFRGWPNSYRISNGTVEAIVTGDVGPRVMRYAFVGGQNLFKEFDSQMGKSGEPDWQPRGGHRVWIAPEDPVRSYAPDNDAVRIDIDGGVLEATQAVEPLTGLEKKIICKMQPEGSQIEVIHQIRNAGATDCKIAAWTLTMMAPGGAGIHGFPPRGTHPEVLAPTNPLVMWAFTNLADPRWRLLQKYLVLLQDPKNSVPQKLGSFHPRTWGAYLLHGELFVKRTTAPAPPDQYPDFGCSFETFTNADFLELETLGPIATLHPGDSLTHTEQWSLHRDVRLDAWTDAELDRAILPVV
ncbi:MAG TPA: hypothetical protein VG456_24960 [Candidatus Sulfopaludibacter sp.]|jgi:hypothetical protein|nr:hypothetical protein [Candidatus Sulfopaludibacter sp.]